MSDPTNDPTSAPTDDPTSGPGERAAQPTPTPTPVARTGSDPASAGVAEADRLIAAALADHVRVPASRRLHDQLARRHLKAQRPWRAWIPAFALGAAAAAIAMVLVRAPAAGPAITEEAVGDHLRIVAAQHPLDVESSDLHNVKPWFTQHLDFAPPVSFLGDDEFRLRGGQLAVFLGHKAAAFVYQRRLHTLTLLVYADAAARPREESTVRGFHVITWHSGGFGMALVSDIAWEDLRQLEALLRS